MQIRQGAGVLVVAPGHLLGVALGGFPFEGDCGAGAPLERRQLRPDGDARGPEGHDAAGRIAAQVHALGREPAPDRAAAVGGVGSPGGGQLELVVLVGEVAGHLGRELGGDGEHLEHPVRCEEGAGQLGAGIEPPHEAGHHLEGRHLVEALQECLGEHQAIEPGQHDPVGDGRGDQVSHVGLEVLHGHPARLGQLDLPGVLRRGDLEALQHPLPQRGLALGHDLVLGEGTRLQFHPQVIDQRAQAAGLEALALGIRIGHEPHRPAHAGIVHRLEQGRQRIDTPGIHGLETFVDDVPEGRRLLGRPLQGPGALVQEALAVHGQGRVRKDHVPDAEHPGLAIGHIPLDLVHVRVHLAQEALAGRLRGRGGVQAERGIGAAEGILEQRVVGDGSRRVGLVEGSDEGHRPRARIDEDRAQGVDAAAGLGGPLHSRDREEARSGAHGIGLGHENPDRQLRAATPDLQDRGSGPGEAVQEVLDQGHRMIVHGQDQVPDPDPRPLCRRSDHHLHHFHAGGQDAVRGPGPESEPEGRPVDLIDQRLHPQPGAL